MHAPRWHGPAAHRRERPIKKTQATQAGRGGAQAWLYRTRAGPITQVRPAYSLSESLSSRMAEAFFLQSATTMPIGTATRKSQSMTKKAIPKKGVASVMRATNVEMAVGEHEPARRAFRSAGPHEPFCSAR